MSVLRTGKWICEQKGIPIEKLAAACNSGKITAYLHESGQKILASSQCRKNFLFADPLYFSLREGSYPPYVGFNKDDLYNFSIYLGKLRVNSGKYDSDDNIDASKSSTVESCTKVLSIIGYNVLQEVYYNNECYLFFFKRNCDYSKTSDIYKNIDCLYPINEIIFAPKRDGCLILRFMDLELHPHREHISKVNISIKEIKYEDNKKFILDKNNDDFILIYNNGLQCIPCSASPLRINKENRHFFSEAYQKCRKYFHQYKLNYYKQDDKEPKKPLKLKTDFFIFDYKEFCQQNYIQECDEAKRDFYEYIESLFFDIKELENIFIDDFEDDEVLNDPLGYMEHKCIYLLKKYKNFDEDKRVIMAYLITIDIDIPYSELHDIFFPSKADRDSSQKTTNFNKYLRKFEKIAEKNNIPYIQASKFRKIDTMEGDREIKNILKEQLAALRVKKREKPKP